MGTKIAMKAKSSSGNPYDVYFEYDENQKKFMVFCTCQAGIHGKLCKHKIQLLDGKASMLFDESDKPMLDQVREWVQKSKYTELISEYAAVKKEIEALQKKEKAARKTLEVLLKNGIEVP